MGFGTGTGAVARVTETKSVGWHHMIGGTEGTTVRMKRSRLERSNSSPKGTTAGTSWTATSSRPTVETNSSITEFENEPTKTGKTGVRADQRHGRGRWVHCRICRIVRWQRHARRCRPCRGDVRLRSRKSRRTASRDQYTVFLWNRTGEDVGSPGSAPIPKRLRPVVWGPYRMPVPYDAGPWSIFIGPCGKQ